MKFEHTQVDGFEAAFRGIRNSYNSWSKSDSYFGLIDLGYHNKDTQIAEKWTIAKNKLYNRESMQMYYNWLHQQGILKRTTELDGCNGAMAAFIGPADMELAQKLIKAGSEHRKFLRQINVSVDITAPLYLFKELSTYKIGTTANSTSTMHTLTNNEITIDCFETDDYSPNLSLDSSALEEDDGIICREIADEIEQMLNFLNILRIKYLETKDIRYWKELVRWLPESWSQTRTWSANYEVLHNIYYQRLNHKLTEWKQFLNWIETLPYAQELIII